MAWSVSKFTVGEIIVSKDGEVVIHILGVNEADNSLDAQVTSVSEFWSRNQERNKSKGFFVQQRLRFVPGAPDEKWILSDQMLPWFVLSVRPDGTKVFDHYR